MKELNSAGKRYDRFTLCKVNIPQRCILTFSLLYLTLLTFVLTLLTFVRCYNTAASAYSLQLVHTNATHCTQCAKANRVANAVSL